MNYTYQAFQEDIINRNLSSFEPLIRPTKLGQNPFNDRIFCFHITDSKEHILSLKHWNHMIQKLKIIYTCRNTTFMKDFRSDKIVLNVKIQTQSEGQDWSHDLMKKLTVSSITLWLRVWHRNNEFKDPKKCANQASNMSSMK